LKGRQRFRFTSGPRQHFDGHFVRQSHVAGGARQVGDGHVAGRAASQPPANVPPLKENMAGAKPLPVHARLEEHRSNPACAGCHKMMDPIGFALENFDALGAWRWNDSGFPVDPTGQLVDGTKVNGPASLRAALVKHSDAFLRNFTEKLLTYALGRGIPGNRILRYAGGASHRPRGGRQQQSLFIVHFGNRSQHSISDEASGGCYRRGIRAA
jgi:Protein of unknown function (DUF1588)/Protein of unknown function (DUF1585)